MGRTTTTPSGGAVADAIEVWRQLYRGDLTPYRQREQPAGLDAVAVRHVDFRDDPGNWPRIMHHRRTTSKVLVLIHGLKDSPGYMDAVARRFAEQGANIVLPLLPAHGRKDPVAAMRQAHYRDWLATVDRAVEIAARLGEEISIGGLSTGGALAFDKALRDPAAVTGKVFMFSAALGLKLFQRLILSNAPLCRLADSWLARRSNGIGGDPHKYARTFLTGARQVHLIIQGLRRRAASDPPGLRQLLERVFVAHSEADRTIDVAMTAPYVLAGDPQQHHIIAAVKAVAHADLVMAEAMRYEKRSPGEPDPPRANPDFEPMMQKALAFFER